MKTNDRLLILATASYSYLFYEQNAGINFLLFNLLFIGVLLYRDKGLLQQKNWLMAAAMCLISGTGIFVHSSALAVIANVFSLLLISAFSFNSAGSFISSFAFSCYSVGTSFIYMLRDATARFAKNDEKGGGEHKTYKFFTLVMVVLLCVLFFVLYRQSNPLFEANTQWINFDFISMSWVVFTAVGFFAVYGLFYHKTIPFVEAWESNLPILNKAGSPEREMQFKTELSAGILLFCFLNFMLLGLNAGDINTIWFKGGLPEGVSHSDFVHNGVGLIILSIMIAMALIMFLYRNDFRRIKHAGLLKLLVYAWIIQNIVMLVSTAFRNQLYIHDYNLTHKRVGVYIWLFLAVVGLLITFIKIRKEYSNWFLIRSNFAIWFGFLAISSVLNWDVMITRYNLRNKPLSDVDFYYLFSLSESNIPELLEVTKHKDFHTISGDLKTYSYSPASSFTPKTYRSLMKTKVRYYLEEYKSSWQSWDLRDKRIMEHLIRH